MRKEDKARFDRLQALVLARAGAKVNQQELLGRLVTLGEKHIEQLAPAKEQEVARSRRLLGSGRPRRGRKRQDSGYDVT